MRARRREPGSLLAFLDVMACGLGAALLLFLIVRHHAERAKDPAPGAAELAALQAEEAALAAEIGAAERREAEARAAETDAAAELRRLRAEASREEERNARLRREVEAHAPESAADPIEDVRGGEEEYLLGLRVEGRNIAFLVDRSASMTDERLIDVIARKVRPDADRKRGPKWRRTLRTARWLLQRLPDRSRAAVIAYNDQARVLGAGWTGAGDRDALRGLLAELEALAPAGATNLEAALGALAELSPAATDVYLVTDGLPTQGVSPPPRGAGCPREPTAPVSGACRRALFRAAAPPTDRKVHVILLPLEGDPEAAPAYWDWTSRAGGLLLAPAGDWP